MIKTVEIKGEKVKVRPAFILCAVFMFSISLDRCLFDNILFSSYKYGTQLDRRDFAPLLRVITVVPTPSFLRMTLPVRTPSGAFQSG